MANVVDFAKQSCEEYDKWSSVYDSSENPTRDLDTLALRSQPIKFQGAILEVGCGTGRHTLTILNENLDKIDTYHALEYSEGMMSKTKEKIESSKTLTDSTKSKVKLTLHNILEPWPCQDNEYDVVFEDLVLEHLDSVAFFFQEASRVIKSDGILFVSEYHPFRQYQGKKAGFQDNKLNVDPPCFVHHTSEFLEAATKSGFRLIQLQEWFDENKDGHKGAPRLISFRFTK